MSQAGSLGKGLLREKAWKGVSPFESFSFIYIQYRVCHGKLVFLNGYFLLNRHVYTHGDKMLHTLLVKRFNDLLDGQKSQRSIDKVTYFYVGDLFCIHLGTKYANFQEKIFADISGRKLQTLCIT